MTTLGTSVSGLYRVDVITQDKITFKAPDTNVVVKTNHVTNLNCTSDGLEFNVHEVKFSLGKVS